MVRVAVLGVAGVLLALQFRGGKEDYGLYISIATGLVIFLLILEKLSVFVSAAGRIKDFISTDADFLAVILKMVGITYAAEFTSGVCRDAGYESVASQVEIFGKLTILISGLPILLALLETITELLR